MTEAKDKKTKARPARKVTPRRETARKVTVDTRRAPATEPKRKAPPEAKRKAPPEPARKAPRTPKPAPAATRDESRELALIIAAAALEKKASAVEILDVVGKVDYADYLVLMTGGSNRHVDALARAIDQACSEKRKGAISVEGLPTASWVLLDFEDVVVHIFQEQQRGLYDIEGLWLDAKRLPVPRDAAE
jgi:ribosome-associated protein